MEDALSTDVRVILVVATCCDKTCPPSVLPIVRTKENIPSKYIVELTAEKPCSTGGSTVLAAARAGSASRCEMIAAKIILQDTRLSLCSFNEMAAKGAQMLTQRCQENYQGKVCG